MIISASRRTDIPAFYSDWFFNRIKAGFAMVRNPMNFNQVSRVRLTPDVVDGIVFWTKNPAPMLDRLEQLEDYPFYFQFTITPYGPDVESFVPSKTEEIITTFKKLSDKIGPEKVLWRYDPIMISDKYPVELHISAFERMAEELYGYTQKATFSFVIQRYREVQRNGKGLDIQDVSEETELDLCRKLAEIARQNGISLEACAEILDVEPLGIKRACCIDGEQFERITGRKFNTVKDPSQRTGCRCVSSIDIGAYNTCKNGCQYCYANYNHFLVAGNYAAHDPEAPLITGVIGEGDKITERKMFSLKGGLL